jgi:hypothetical protein
LVISQNYVDLPSDFDVPSITSSGYVYIGDRPYAVTNIKDAQDIPAINKYVYVYGNAPQGYKLHINPTPDEDADIVLDYFSTYYAVDNAGDDVSVLTSDDDKTKCPRPDFIVFDVLAFLYKSDDESNKGLDMERQARQALFDMITAENLSGDGDIPVDVESKGYNIFDYRI